MRLFKLHVEEQVYERMPAPTIEELVKHAERFGSHMVVDTAIGLGYEFDAVVRLQRQCDVIDLEHWKKEHGGRDGGWPRPKKSVEDRVKKLMGIKDEQQEPGTGTTEDR